METARQTNLRLRKKLIKLADLLRIARHSADHDVLTGLPNRRLFYDRLQQAMAISVRQERQLAVLMIDLDGFKQINDNLGHATGDELLQVIAERLDSCLRASDTAARLGGDEFAVMLPEIRDPQSVVTVINKIRQILDAPYLLTSKTVDIGASVGVSVYRGEPIVACALLELADHDMYRVKQARQNLSAEGNGKPSATSIKYRSRELLPRRHPGRYYAKCVSATSLPAQLSGRCS
ncbi:GGDEF domain-containing protein [Chitinimonas arctica]|nr:GGDEF domain-containing protein [Chitinimonas arctica]